MRWCTSCRNLQYWYVCHVVDNPITVADDRPVGVVQPMERDYDDDDHFNLVRQGNERLALKFVVVLAATGTVVAYTEFENIVEVDRDRNVVFDFGVWIRTRLIGFWNAVCVTLMECLASTICPKILICWCAIRIRPTNPVVIGSLSTSRMIVETFLTRLDVDLIMILNVIWIVTVHHRTLMINSYRV